MGGMILNFSMYQAGWLSSVLGAARELPMLGVFAMFIAVAIHLYRAQQPERELMLVLICGFIGAMFDSVLVALNWVSYPSGLFSPSMAPYWIITMWMLFATTLNVSLRWLRGRYWLAAVLGFVSGPAAYFGGYKLGGIVFIDQQAALLSLAIGWGLMMPVLVKLAERFDGYVEEVPAVAVEVTKQ